MLIRPRLNDFHDLPFTQEEVDFAIPFLDEDIPLYLDPFLLWKSPSMQDNALHGIISNSFNHLGHLIKKNKEKEASEILIRASECTEVGLGTSANKRGLRIGEKTATSILSLFQSISQITKGGFTHFEEIQLYVDQISKDRVSDISSNFLKSFLIDFTIQQCDKHKIPMEKARIHDLYDHRKNQLVEEEAYLPINPETKKPVLLVPKRWLRYIPWINYEDYFDCYFVKEVWQDKDNVPSRVEILEYNRKNYDVVQNFIKMKEKTSEDCKNDPLFKSIPITSAKRKLNVIVKLPSGKTDNADKKYEDHVCQLMASALYPHLDFAQAQSRTDSGALIRDLIFYNNRSFDFLKDIYDDYKSRQIVMELKNVAKVERDHVNQLNRYLTDSFGSFGILITRNPLPKPIFKNTIDLWSGQRKCIIALTDEDLKLMVSVYESKQRHPIEVIKKKYLEFRRSCPS
ncbi:hypothetical protein QYF52_25485 [Paenibacillus polymyxa]|uniref:hypothetical protein n=1 Tax=Paenibacillus polymyxa TaxID=1406 RepID=UPI0025B64BD2|nr:hypothetical protein [Paenibacillus polymyxa]MDN4081281.1 hypothetical protein [Paenibacillus polymyxa]MDN4106984.1 hypothetical protein [Paenibacillus polymyxa]MDN4116930.1 hypothetical protein [Paenibacillus polymyxa]